MKNNDIKSKVNDLYFNQKKTTSEIMKILDINYGAVISKIDRSKMFSKETKSIINNPQEIEVIIQTIIDYYNISKDMLKFRSRIKEIILPRQITYHIARKLTNSSNAFIGELLGGFSPATVLHGTRSIDDYLISDKEVSKIYDELKNLCIKELKSLRND